MKSFSQMTRALVARKRKIFALFFALAASIGLSWAETANAKLPGKFSVSAEQVVYFSRGNLQYTRESTEVDWSTGTFRLATNQYDMIETIANPYCTDNCGDKTEIGLFGWGTWGEGKTPNLTTHDQTAYTWSTDFTGTLEGYNDWRTLSKDEWVYLLNTRATGVTVNSTADARYTMATINTDGTPVAGLIIFPDAFAGAETAGVTWGTINDKSDFVTTCTTAGWTALEQAGCVFLPACGQRSKINSTANVRTGGCGTSVLYYTSTVYTDFAYGAHNICFTKSDALADDGSGVRQAFGVRLVSNNPAPSGTCGDNLTWSLNTETGALTISGTGAMNDYSWDPNAAPWYAYRNDITSVSFPEGITTIGAYAFVNCDNAAFTTVTIPEGVTALGVNAFYNCDAIQEITIPSTVTTFGVGAIYDCKAVNSITSYITSPTNLHGNAINGYKNTCTLYVPYNSIADYQAADCWKNIPNIAAIPGTLTPESVAALISAIGEVEYTAESKAKIDAAREAYDGLVDEDKAQVTNFSTLTDAEAAYAQLLAQAVAAVKAQIDALPATPLTDATKKLSEYNKVLAAREAYDALSDEEKAAVTNYDKLTAAEAAFAAIGGGGGAPLPEGALTGAFSINADGDKIAFSKGNLQATTEDLGETWTWAFAAHQYDYVGNAVANTAITGNKTVSTNGTIDLFGWSTAATYYGINNTNVSGKHPGDFIDWGETIAEGWRTLTRDEWNYLFETRTDAASKYGHATVAGIHGIIVLPDSYKGTAINADRSDWSNNIISAEDWAAYEANGVAFLPAAGSRLTTNVNYVGEYGLYWTSTTYGEKWAYRVRFLPNLSPDYGDRVPGHSVRLVTAHAGGVTPLDSAQAAKDLIDAIGEVSYPDSKEAIKAAREAVDALGANASLLDDADLQKLTDAEAAYAQLLAQAVAAVKDQIDALPATPLTDATKKLSEYNKVLAAREAYDALSDEEKTAVDNYGKLTAAEEAFAAIGGGTKPVDIVWNKNTGIANVTPGSTSPAYEGMTITTGSGSSFSQNSEGRMNFMFYSQNGGFTFANENGYNITKVVIESTTALTSTMTEVDRMGSGWAISNENKTATWTGDAATVKIWEGRTFTNYWYVDSIVFTVNGASSPLDSAQAAKDLIDSIPSPVVLSDECNAAIQAAREAVTALGENASLLDDADIDKLAIAEADFALLIKDATAVADMIDAIGEVTFSSESKGKIVDARNAYDALSDELKPYVSNLATLTAAEAAYEAARPFAPVTTVPAAVEALQYTGAAQALITAGAAEHGTVLYSLDGENYSAEIPTALLAGAYTIYYKVQATDDYKDVAPVTVIATIAYNYPATYGLFGIPEGWSVKVNDEEVAVVNGAVKNIAANDRFDIMPVKPEDVKLVEVVPYLLDLATVTDSVIYILDGDSITGTANGNISIVIVPDAKVYFKDVNLTNTGSHPAVLCGGNAEIVVVGENSITCTTEGEYGIRAAGAGTTLTISGDKTLLNATIDPNGGTVNQ